jgi:hypothetical protein
MFFKKKDPQADREKEKAEEKVDAEKNCFELQEDGMQPRELALARCNCLMDRYLRWKKENHNKSNWCQYPALVLTAITPVLLLIPSDAMRFVAAASTATAAIATGLLTINRWRDNYIRYGSTWHALQGEKYLYLTGATKEYSNSNKMEAARAFASRVEYLVMDEVTNWQAMMQRPEPKDGGGDLNQQGTTLPPASPYSNI